jgi:hypothetical protein
VTKDVKNSTKKVIYEIANNRFVEQGRNDIELCVDGFVGWKKKSKFYDDAGQRLYVHVINR